MSAPRFTTSQTVVTLHLLTQILVAEACDRVCLRPGFVLILVLYFLTKRYGREKARAFHTLAARVFAKPSRFMKWLNVVQCRIRADSRFDFRLFHPIFFYCFSKLVILQMNSDPEGLENALESLDLEISRNSCLLSNLPSEIRSKVFEFLTEYTGEMRLVSYSFFSNLDSTKLISGQQIVVCNGRRLGDSWQPSCRFANWYQWGTP